MNSSNDPNGCGLFFIIIIILAFTYFSQPFGKDKPNKTATEQQAAQELTTYKIISVKSEWRLFGQDGNTVIENTKTGERKTLVGKIGKEGEEIKLKY